MAYAAVISLKRTIDRLLYTPTNPQITSAYNELKLLHIILKRLDDRSNKRIDRTVINALDAKIREAANKLEDEIEYWVFYRSPQPYKEIEIKIDLFMKTVKKLREDYTGELDKSPAGEEEVVVRTIKKPTTPVVGLSDQLRRVKNELLNLQSRLKIVSIFGMAGIGKTRLARENFQHPIVVELFDLRAWVSVGPKDELKNALVEIVAQIKVKPRKLYMEESVIALTKLVQESLRGRRYLIVFDDVWSTRVHDELFWRLPNDENGSRVLLTTRLEEVAKHDGNRIHRMEFLNKEESWNLLGQSVFGEEFINISSSMERVGRKIAEYCEGLPLLILTVASILRGAEKTEEYWKKVADKKTTTFTDAYDQISNVLSSSYEYLPQHLKPYFLYMGVFPQSFEIPSPKLVSLWAVEDFLEPVRLQTLEDTAMECLTKLVSSSLAIVCKQSYNRTIKSCKLHSAYWHVCVKEARKNKFLHVLKRLTDCSEDYMESQRRLSVQTNMMLGIKEVYDSVAATLTARSLQCTGEDHQYQVPVCFDLKLLKVLDALAIRFYEFPEKVVKLMQLRYLALTHNGNLPSSISELQQLQCLIVRQPHNIKFVRDSDSITYLPMEIWDMQELRQLQIMGSNLPDPLIYGTDLPNLLTLNVSHHSCTEAAFRKIPNLKKLRIRIELHPHAAETLRCFRHTWLLLELESLKCVVMNPRPRIFAPADDLSNLPKNLKELSLNGLGYSWEYITTIARLPNLQVLKLRCSAFQGPEWRLYLGQFRSLEFLLLEDIDLVQWIPKEGSYVFYFLRLRCLIIRHCYKLKKINRKIGRLPALETVELIDCIPSLVASPCNLPLDKARQNRRSSSRHRRRKVEKPPVFNATLAANSREISGAQSENAEAQSELKLGLFTIWGK